MRAVSILGAVRSHPTPQSSRSRAKEYGEKWKWERQHCRVDKWWALKGRQLSALGWVASWVDVLGTWAQWSLGRV